MVDSATAIKTVATPRDEYIDKHPLWVKCRAVCGGEEAVKEHDALVTDYENFLIPFSPSMTQTQYNFLKQEAELPGVCAEFAHLLVGALLRKEPEVVLPKDAPEGAVNWITNEFGSDGSPLVTYMDALLWEEVVSSRGWTFVDYIDGLPVPIHYPAESVINWRYNRSELTQVIVLAFEEVEGKSEFHPEYQTVCYVHELNEQNRYQVRRFTQPNDNGDWVQDEKISLPLFRNKPLDYLPIWPNNGELEPPNPFLLNLVNKEIALYNKLTRRNHLLYGAATYTPYMTGGVDEEAFQKAVGSGLGSWLNLPADADIKILSTPTEALADLEKAIAAGFEEMARLGVRMLSPETSQSGVALQLRNASQTAKVGTLNTRISVIMSQVIALMINWKYGTEYKPEDIKFNLQSDFTTTTVGEGWMRLATEWYENGHIPRSVWLTMLRQNDALPDDYNDEEGREEIQKEQDEFASYSDKLEQGLENEVPV